MATRIPIAPGPGGNQATGMNWGRAPSSSAKTTSPVPGPRAPSTSRTAIAMPKTISVWHDAGRFQRTAETAGKKKDIKRAAQLFGIIFHHFKNDPALDRRVRRQMDPDHFSIKVDQRTVIIKTKKGTLVLDLAEEMQKNPALRQDVTELEQVVDRIYPPRSKIAHRHEAGSKGIKGTASLARAKDSGIANDLDGAFKDAAEMLSSAQPPQTPQEKKKQKEILKSLARSYTLQKGLVKRAQKEIQSSDKKIKKLENKIKNSSKTNKPRLKKQKKAIEKRKKEWEQVKSHLDTVDLFALAAGSVNAPSTLGKTVKDRAKNVKTAAQATAQKVDVFYQKKHGIAAKSANISRLNPEYGIDVGGILFSILPAGEARQAYRDFCKENGIPIKQDHMTDALLQILAQNNTAKFYQMLGNKLSTDVQDKLNREILAADRKGKVSSQKIDTDTLLQTAWERLATHFV